MIKRVGIVGLGDHGIRHRRGGRQGGHRGHPAVPPAADGRRAWWPHSRSRSTSRSSGASSTRPSATQVLVAGHGHARPARPRRLRPRDRVGRRGPRRQEGAVPRARPRCQGRGDPRHQHLDAAGRRAGDGDRASRAGLRHPLLQPGAGDEPRRGGAAAHRQRRDDRARAATFAELVRQGAPSRSRTAPGSSSTRCCSRT